MNCKTILKISLLTVISFCFAKSTHAKENSISFRSKKEIKANLTEGIHEMFEVRINKNVKKYINSYLVRGKSNTQRIIGNASIYFPIFEEYLAAHNLPDELKYLSVIESHLNPNAISPSGAVGLWQFMAPTAREMGPDAGLKYLQELHARYQDWGLAIAAYNCGPGRVDRELRRTNGHSFWDIRSSLPKQTQHYIDRFIAVNYAMKNYQFYNLRPRYPDYTLQMPQVQKIHTRFSFAKIAALTGINSTIIAQLNPSYRKEIIPPNHNGYYLVLPALGVKENWQETP